jgi:hypothetical protein
MVFTTRFSGFPATLDADFNRWRGMAEWLPRFLVLQRNVAKINIFNVNTGYG